MIVSTEHVPPKVFMFQMITNYEESQLECKFFSVETISFEHLHVVAMTI